MVLARISKFYLIEKRREEHIKKVPLSHSTIIPQLRQYVKQKKLKKIKKFYKKHLTKLRSCGIIYARLEEATALRTLLIFFLFIAKGCGVGAPTFGHHIWRYFS